MTTTYGLIGARFSKDGYSGILYNTYKPFLITQNMENLSDCAKNDLEFRKNATMEKRILSTKISENGRQPYGDTIALRPARQLERRMECIETFTNPNLKPEQVIRRFRNPFTGETLGILTHEAPPIILSENVKLTKVRRIKLLFNEIKTNLRNKNILLSTISDRLPKSVNKIVEFSLKHLK